jgi:hypothetical protein
MPVLQFSKSDTEVILKKGVLKNITLEPRTKIMPKDTFLCKKYQIDTDVFITQSALIMRLATKEEKDIDALYCKHKGCHIIIVPPKTYLFYNDKSVEPVNYTIGGKSMTDDEIMRQSGI